MSEELQGLLKRIKEEGITQVQTEKKEMLEQAKIETAEILEKAHREADLIIKNAETKAKQSEQRGEEALRQPSRDLRISVRDVLTRELEATVKLEVKQAMTKDTMVKIIEKMIHVFEKQQGQVDGIDVLLSAEDHNELASYIINKFSGRLKEGVTLKPSSSIEAGIQIGTKGDNLFIDFTDEALTEMLCKYLNPHISKLVLESLEK